MSDDMDWMASFLKRPIHGLVKMPPYEQIGTLGIQSDAGEVRLVADAAQPGIQLHQIHVGSQEAGDDYNSRRIAVWHAKSVVGWRSVKQKYLNAK
jgi:hypothetical protein